MIRSRSHFRFKWQAAAQSENVVVTVVDNRNREVWRRSAQGSEIEFDEKLAPGLYYWKIQVGERLQGVGKFVVGGIK